MKRMRAACLAIVLLSLLSVPTLASSGTVHVVQPGQTLLSIARWYGVDPWVLARANNIINPNRIYVGQRLLIPTGGYIAPAGSYLVKPGDTLYSIARRYGVTVWAIAQANGIYNLSRIYAGQYLVIPSVKPPAPTPQPTPKPSPTQLWRGEYYSGTTPSGGPRFVRYDSAINFHWGAGGPDGRVGHDEFSVHWSRTILFRGGLYRFKVVTDDGARVWIDGQLVLDAWRVQPETAHAVDVVLDPGNHVVAVDYFEASGVATIQFSFSRLGSAPPVTVTPKPVTPTQTPPPTSVAWYGQYFSNPDLSGSPAATRMDDAIGFEWGAGVPIGGVGPDNFSVRWTRTASFSDDNYAFCAMSDDGVRFFVDGHLVLNEWHPSNSVAYCAEADMTAGEHQLRVEYYEGGGNALIYAWWERR
ncbi:MAG: PA14 domain-containing protein [Anaerolineae bacterium]